MPLKHLTSKPVKMATSLKILVGRNGEPNQNGKYGIVALTSSEDKST